MSVVRRLEPDLLTELSFSSNLYSNTEMSVSDAQAGESVVMYII